MSTRGRAERIVAWIVFLGLGFWARLWLVGFWIFGDLVGEAFDSWIVPVLGFIFMPWATLTYVFMWSIGSDRVAGWEWIVVGIALAVDFLFWAWSRSAFK